MIQEILGGLILIVALVMIAMRFKKQVTVGEGNHQCDDCKRSYTPHTWQAVCQVRQKVC